MIQPRLDSKGGLIESIHKGITLVEIMVVTVVLAVLSALILTSVQSAREAARASSCQNRLRQLSLGMQQYETANNFLPPGILGVAEAFVYEGNYHITSSPHCWRRFQYVSFLGLTLPYMEEQTVFSRVAAEMFDISRTLEQVPRPSGSPPYRSFLDVSAAVQLAQQDVPGFRCPSDTLATTTSPDIQFVMGALQPVVNGAAREDRLGWVNLIERHPGTFTYGNYAASLGAHSGGIHQDDLMRRFTGLMSSRAIIRAKDCKDGLSRTVVVGETLGEVHEGRRTIVSSWLFGAVVRGRGMTPWLRAPRDAPLLGDDKTATFVGFASLHPSAVHIAFGDGHVAPVERGVDWKAWYRQCGRADEGTIIAD